MASRCARLTSGSSPCRSASAASTTSSGPIHTGQHRNVATPATAAPTIGPGDGCSSQTTSAHHIATAKSSDTTCAR